MQRKGLGKYTLQTDTSSGRREIGVVTGRLGWSQEIKGDLSVMLT